MLPFPLPLVPEIVLRQTWRTALSRPDPFNGGSAPYVADGRAYVETDRTGEGPTWSAFELRTGRRLWRRAFPRSEPTRLVAGGGHLLAVGMMRMAQLDPRDGRTVWETDTAPDALGPVIEGDRVAVETTWGRLEAIDLRMHRRLWRLDLPVQAGGGSNGGLWCVAGGTLCAQAADGVVFGVALADGRLRWARRYGRGALRGIVAAGGKVVLDGEARTEAWSLADGATRWVSYHPALREPIYAARPDELWTLDRREGEMFRFRAATGARVGEPESLCPCGAGLWRIARTGEGYVAMAAFGSVRLDTWGRATGVASGVGWFSTTPVDDGGFVCADGKEVVRLDATGLAARPRTSPSADRAAGGPLTGNPFVPSFFLGWEPLLRSGDAAALSAARARRRAWPVPTWAGDAPPAPRGEAERALAAAFETVARAMPPGSPSLSVLYGPGKRPFAVAGWTGTLRAIAVPRLGKATPRVRAPEPSVEIEALDLDGTMVRFSVGGTEAVARLAVTRRGLPRAEVELRLRRFGRDWFAVAASPPGRFGISALETAR